jgi:peptidoglycan/xylan/chitin deacetylase (PgdA/CDA1 family)
MRRLILAFLFIAPLSALLLWRTSPFAAVGVVFISHMFALYPTLNPSSQWWGRVIRRFEPEGKEVWLTIDDGTSGEQSLEISRLLLQRNARATFFVKGVNARREPEIVRALVEAGHEVANHSDTHPSGSFWILPGSSIEREIAGCSIAIERATGARPQRFRAPVGMKNFFVHPSLERNGLTLIGWDVRAFDGVGNATPESIVKRVMPQVRPGSIIVVHEGRTTSPQIIEALADALRSEGYSLVVPRAEQLRA